MESENLDEEGKALLRKILIGQAYRQIMAANIRGHGLKFLHTTDGRKSLIDDLGHILGQIRRVQAIYSAAGGGDLREAASPKMDRIPYPGSKLELAAFLATSDLAEEVAMEGYAESTCTSFAEVARDNLIHERTATKRGQQLFEAFALEPTQQPHAQQMFNRWVVIALLALGRPGTKGDQRAVALGLRTRSCADAARIYLERLEPFMQACKLELPDLKSAGVSLPA